MADCLHCSGPGGQKGHEESCCWERAMKIKRFKSFVLYKYIFEVIFDVLVSVLSVVTDVITLIFYIQKHRWSLAIITAIPVLLPTIVFTNVYLAEETKGYCKLPEKRKVKTPVSRAQTPISVASSTLFSSEEGKDPKNLSEETGPKTSNVKSSPKTEKEGRVEKLKKSAGFHCPGCNIFCYSCQGCWGGMFHSICHKDIHLRRRGVEMLRKSVKRLSKYFFGTFVLRFIALGWYFKALIFGIKAYREPKKFMRMERPTTHWSYDLLVRLDFLQAALENAPQCIVQLYALLCYPDENVILGILTLLFSFMDFVRVSVSVQWDLRRGPIIAPSGCYGSLPWKLLNMSSWIFLYIGRSAALALVFATADGWTISIPAFFLTLHVIIFTKLLSKAKYGVAAQKVFVSVFISIFFLPEFHSNELPILIQFYYAVIHIQNLFFIVPWRGMDYEYCFAQLSFLPPARTTTTARPTPIAEPTFRNFTDIQNATLWDQNRVTSSFDRDSKQHCLIDPMIIVLAVPALTMIGIVMRLSASKKMVEYKQSLPAQQDSMIMEERVANIYRKKWTQMSFMEMVRAFVRMLRKEVITSVNEEKVPRMSVSGGKVFLVSKTLQEDFKRSQEFIQSMSFLPSKDYGDRDRVGRTKRSMSVDAYGIQFRKDRTILPELEEFDGYTSEDGKDSNNTWAYRRPKLAGDSEERLLSPEGKGDEGLIAVEDFKELGTEEGGFEQERFDLIRIDGPEGPYFLEMSWI